jgi:hypothetical protein
MSILAGSIHTPAGYWHHFSFVFKGTQTSIYVNGTLSGSKLTMADSFKDKTDSYTNYFGRTQATDFGNVDLDEITIYNKTLTTDQIKADMNKTSSLWSGIC